MSDIMEVTASIDREKWSEFVYEHPNGNIFQTPEMRDVYERTKNYEPITLATVDDDGEILALMQAVVIREMGGFLGSFSARAVVQGGPLFVEGAEGRDAIGVLMEYYDKIIQRKVVYSEIRNMWDTMQVSCIFTTMEYIYEEHLNFLVDITKSKKELWDGLSKSGRRFVRKAKGNGLIIEDVQDCSLIPIFYNLLQDTYKNVKVPLADVSLFKSAFDVLAPKDMLKVFLLNHEGIYIGGMVAPMYKGTIYEWYICSHRAYSKLYPSELVTWHPIEWGSENGYHVFDFLGAGKPDTDYGVREFKSKFGGELVNFGRYKKIHSPSRMKIAELGYEVYKKVIL